MTASEILDVFRVVAAVLKLGNLSFVPTTNMDGTEGCAINNDYGNENYFNARLLLPIKTFLFAELYDASEVLRGDYACLQNALISRSFEARHEVMVTDLSAREAAASRDALCRAAYARLFTWLVNRANEALKPRTPRTRKSAALGILDLFGFEAGEANNGFERLVFNYAAEKLHQFVTRRTLIEEEQELIIEGINVSEDRIGFEDNSVVCDTIERNNLGLLTLLDEVSLRKNRSHLLLSSTCSSASEGDRNSPNQQKPKSNVFMSRLEEVFGEDKEASVLRLLPESPFSFVIKHFAGDVAYDSNDFVERNSDHLSRDLSHAMFECGVSLLKVLFPEGK